MEKSFKVFSCLFLSLICFCFIRVHAQSKSHFRVLENGIEVQNTFCHSAVEEINLDLYRYTDARRIITIEGSPYTLELFSGQELWVNYQKQINPNNRPLLQEAYPQLRFVASGNRIKVLLN